MISKNTTLLLGAAALLLCGAAGASAADLNGGGYATGGSIKDSYVSPMVQYGPTWYGRIDFGYGTHDDPTIVENGIWDLSNNSIEDTWTLGGGIGYYANNNVRFDVTYDHRFESDVEGTSVGAGLTGLHKFGLKSDVVLANAYYDFDMRSHFTPYVGAGLGWVRHSTTGGTVSNDCGCNGIIEGKDTDHVAGALMAGVSVNLFGLRGGNTVVSGGSIKDAPVYAAPSRGLYLDVGYRFLYLGEAQTGQITAVQASKPVVVQDPTVSDIHSHEFRVGLRYDIF